MYVPTWPHLSPAYLWENQGNGNLPFPFNAPVQSSFYAARYGIYHLFRALRFEPGDTVLVPDYHHGNEVKAIRAAGATIRFYPIRRNLEPDLECIEHLCRSNPRALYVIHYLGWPQPIKELAAICRERGILLIEDCALSLLGEAQGTPLGAFGDYAIYCLYKTLPVPNGGLLVQNRNHLGEPIKAPVHPCPMLSVANRSLDLGLEWLRCYSNSAGKILVGMKKVLGQCFDQAGVKRLPVGNSAFEPAHANVSMSSFSQRLLKKFDYREIRERRRSHYQYLSSRLAGHVELLRPELGEDACPLFFPILVADKHSAAQSMWDRGIGAVEFWNDGDREVNEEDFPDSYFLRRHVLEIPIHQDLRTSQMEFLADQVLSLRQSF